MIRKFFLSLVPLIALVFVILASGGAQAQLAMTFWGTCTATGGSFSHVQSVAGPSAGPVSISTWSSTFASAVTSGNMVVGFVTFDTTQGTSLVSIVDDKNNTYLTPTGGFINDPGHNQAIQAFYVANVTNGPKTVNVNFSNNTGWIRVYLDEFSGAAPSPLDKAASNMGTSTNATDGASTPSVTTGSMNELVYGVYQSINGSSATQTTGTGFTIGINGSVDQYMTGLTEYLVQSAPGPVAATITVGAILANDTAILTFVPQQANCQSQAGGGGGGGGGGNSGPIVANKQFWGTGGHNSTGSGQYGSVTVAQEAADMHTVFSNTANVIPFRGDAAYSREGADTTNFQTAGIIPLWVINANPNFSSFANQTAAYNAGYSDASSVVASVPTARLFEIGNEWTIYSPYAVYSGDGSTAANWRAGTYYPVMLGYTAGAVAAIRDKLPGTGQVIGGAYAGWIPIGLPIAMGTDLQNYNSTGRDLRWDFTVVHWYQDSCGGNNGGTDLANYDGGRNVYTQLKPIGKPIFVSEFGSAACSPTDATAAGYVTAIMNNLLAHKATTATEPGVAGGTFYQLYNADYNSWLFNTPGGSLTATGTAVQAFITANGNGN